MEKSDLLIQTDAYCESATPTSKLAISDRKYLDWILLPLLENNSRAITELEDIYTPIFLEHGLIYEKKYIKLMFPPYTTKRKLINGISKTYYVFNF